MARTSTMAARFGFKNDKRTWRRGLARWSTLVACAVLLVGPPASASAQEATNLMDTLGVNADLSTFTQMLETAGLGDTLRAPGALTVWAPVNAGFDKLPAATKARLNSDTALLKTVLSYHLASQPVTAAQIVQVPSVRTLEGESVRVQAAEGSVHLNDTTVLRPDVRASNGIIHVIDGVLLPPSIS